MSNSLQWYVISAPFRGRLVFSSLLAVVLVILAGRGHAEWVVSTVDGNEAGRDVGSHASLALDSNDRPHISYFHYLGSDGTRESGVLTYLTADSNGWLAPVVVDEVQSTGHWSDIAIDSQDAPHISYHDFGNHLLKYATHNNGGWEIISDLGEPGLDGDYTSLALDSNDQPHISFRHVVQNRVAYTYRSGAQWNVDVLEDPGRFTSLALDNSDRPNISFYRYDGANPPRLIHVEYNPPSDNWIRDELDVTAQATWSSLALDSRGRPHISYLDSDTRNLRHAYYDVQWRFETIEASVGELGTHNSIAIDSTGAPHVAYYDVRNGALKYAYRFGGEWLIEVVDDGEDHHGVGMWPSIAIDSQDRPHIAYLDMDNTALKYAVRYPCGADDFDCDGILNHQDNCPDRANIDQADADADGRGDDCDNCPSTENWSQEDFNFDGKGDACDCADGFWGPHETGADCGGVCAAECHAQCVPVVRQGDSDGKLDIVFLMPEGGDWTTWRNDVLNMIRNGYYADPLTYRYRRKMNFYYARQEIPFSVASSGYCDYVSTNTRWREGCSSSAFGVILHDEQCTNKSQGYLFSVTKNGYATLLHESAHSTYSLKDEYDDSLRGCVTSYHQIDPFPNIYKNERNCRRLSLAPDECRMFTSCDGDWWKANPDNTVMDKVICHPGRDPFCNGWGPDSERRIKWVLGEKYRDPPPSQTRKALVGYFRISDGELELYDTEMVYGDTPERIFEREGLQLDFYASNGSRVNAFSIRDPRYIHYSEPHGSAWLDETAFSVVFPYRGDLKTLEVTDIKSGQHLNVFDISRPIRSFCEGHPGDPDCATYDADNDGKPDLRDNCPDVANANQSDQDGDGYGDACDRGGPVLGVHLGTALPQGNFGANYDPGPSVVLDAEQAITSQMAVVGMLGYHSFAAASSTGSDTYWWHLSVNARYRSSLATGNPRTQWYLNWGLGAYVPKRGSTKVGANLGGGVNLQITPVFGIRFGGEYHSIFTSGARTEFATPYLGFGYQF